VCAVARGATEESLDLVGGAWIGAPEVAGRIAAADRVVTF
jgi:hypothetical protein